MRMDKNKIYKMYKGIFIEKQVDEIMGWKQIATYWAGKDKLAKKDLKRNKKMYNGFSFK